MMNHCTSRLRRAQRLNAGHRRSGGPFATPAFVSARIMPLVLQHQSCDCEASLAPTHASLVSSVSS